MTEQIINVGTNPNDGTGDPLRTAFSKADADFTDLYTNKLDAAGGTITDYSEALANDGNSGTALTVNLADGNVQEITLTGNVTLSISGAAASGTDSSVTLFLIQDATGSRTVTWPTTTKWTGGVAPTLSIAAGAIDVVVLTTFDGGTTWFGFLAGQGMA